MQPFLFFGSKLGTYTNSKLVRGSSIVTGRVGRTVMISLLRNNNNRNKKKRRMTSAIDKFCPFTIPSNQASLLKKERERKKKRHTIGNSNLALIHTRLSS